MLTFFSFVFMWFGSLNWFFISAFQYDIIAGFFGTQSSLFSRLIYFIIGIAGFVLLAIALKNKGIIKLTENPFKKPKKTPSAPEVKVQEDPEEYHYPRKIEAIEASKEGYKDFDVTKYDK